MALRSSNDPDWNLEKCCESVEYVFMAFYFFYIVANFVLWNSVFIKPMKLVAVFVHEMGHATACWITGGKVNKIEVYDNEGGVTEFQGGCRCLVIPAGYVGGAFWGGFLVAMSGNRIGSTVSAGVFVLANIVTLFYSPNSTLVKVSVFFIIVTGIFMFLDWYVYDPILQYVTLYYGVTIGFFSVYDIYDDLITRTVEGSDAHACHQLIPCCFPRCVGVQFIIVALAFQALGLYFALLWLVQENE